MAEAFEAGDGVNINDSKKGWPSLLISFPCLTPAGKSSSDTCVGGTVGLPGNLQGYSHEINL